MYSCCLFWQVDECGESEGVVDCGVHMCSTYDLFGRLQLTFLAVRGAGSDVRHGFGSAT